jgi:hypothetical protein
MLKQFKATQTNQKQLETLETKPVLINLNPKRNQNKYIKTNQQSKSKPVWANLNTIFAFFVFASLNPTFHI